MTTLQDRLRASPTSQIMQEAATALDALCAEAKEQARLLGISAERELAMRAENERLREVLAVAHDHIDMSRLEISHCNDAALIRAALQGDSK